MRHLARLEAAGRRDSDGRLAERGFDRLAVCEHAEEREGENDGAEEGGAVEGARRVHGPDISTASN